MGEIIPMHPDEPGYDKLFGQIWAKIGPAAMEARDLDSNAQANVMIAITLAMARAIAIMAQGDRPAADIIRATAHEALDGALDEAVDLMAVMNGVVFQ